MKRNWMYAAAAGALIAFNSWSSDVNARTIIDEWNSVKAPAPPALKPAPIDAGTTALLIADVNKQTCTEQRRPRCVAALPNVQKILRAVRAKGIPVFYTLSGTTTAADILPEIAPAASDTVLPSFGPDKLMGNDLEESLKSKGIKTLIAVGTAAHTSILHTASQAALRGYQVVVPIDAMSSDDAYQEQYTIMNLATASRVNTKVTLTSTDLVKF